MDTVHARLTDEECLVLEKEEIEYLLNAREAISFALSEQSNPSAELIDTSEWFDKLLDFVKEKWVW